MRHGSLFSGIGGFDLAAEWMGWENIFHCEWNPFGQKILKHYWPNAKRYSDITKTDFTIHRGEIDILTGGFPCQPYSQAGKRKGKEDERHLWPEMLRAIREIQPGWVVGENVSGLLNWNGGMVLAEIKADLESAGFEVFPPCVLPACGKDAPHKRERLWIIAHSDSNANRNFGKQDRKKNSLQSVGGEAVHARHLTGANTGLIADTTTQGLQKSRFEPGKQKVQQKNGIKHICSNATNSGNERLQGSEINGSVGGIRENRNEQPSRFLQPNWQNFPTQPPICSGNDGLSSRLVGITFPKHRNESIKGYGNAIVPQVAFEIFKAIEQTINANK